MIRIIFLSILFYQASINAQVLSADEKAGVLSEIRELDSLISKQPSAENYYYRGKFRSKVGDYNKAASDLDKAIALNPQDFDSHLERGDLLDKVQDYRSAIEDFNTCIELKSNSGKAYSHRAYAKSKLNDLKGAIADYTESLSLMPNQADAYFNIGIAKQKLEQHREAIADFDKAIGIDGNLTEAIASRAISKSVTNDKTALDDFNTVVKRQPNNAQAYFNRALFYLNNRVKADYCADLKKALALGYTEAEAIKKEVCK